MGQEATVLEHHIQQERAQLADSVDQIERKVSRAADWRYQFARYPGIGVGIAFAAGFLLAGVASSRRHYDESYDNRRRRTRRYDSPTESHLGNLINGLQAAIVGVVANEARVFLRRRLGYDNY